MQNMTYIGSLWNKVGYLRYDVTEKENIYLIYLQISTCVLTASVQSFAEHKSLSLSDNIIYCFASNWKGSF